MSDGPRFKYFEFSRQELSAGMNTKISDDYVVIKAEVVGNLWMVLCERVKQYEAIHVFNPEPGPHELANKFGIRCTQHFPMEDGRGQPIRDPIHRCVYTNHHEGPHRDSQSNTWS